jgi:hypothetical protein
MGGDLAVGITMGFLAILGGNETVLGGPLDAFMGLGIGRNPAPCAVGIVADNHASFDEGIDQTLVGDCAHGYDSIMFLYKVKPILQLDCERREEVAW